MSQRSDSCQRTPGRTLTSLLTSQTSVSKEGAGGHRPAIQLVIDEMVRGSKGAGRQAWPGGRGGPGAATLFQEHAERANILQVIHLCRVVSGMYVSL